MARTALLALLCLAGIAACSATPALRWIRFSSGDEPSEPSCLTYKDQDSCLDHACGWCSSDLVGDLGCLSESFAKLVPQAFAECKVNDPTDDDDDDDDDDVIDDDNDDDGEDDEDDVINDGELTIEADKPKPKPKLPASCGDNKDKRDCLKLGADEGDCAWCEGDFMPASCVGVKAAEWIPEQVAKCKMPKKHKKHDDDDDDDLQADKPDKPKPKPAVSCGDNKEKRDCLKLGADEGDCAWCEGDFMPASCVGVKAAEWIPEQVAKCKMPKKHKKDDDSVTASNKMAATCMDIKDSRDCVKRGSKEEECAWCEGKFLPSGCIGVDKAKFIPEQVATCKMPKHIETTLTRKHHKKHDKSGGGGWIPGGGDWPSGGGDYPSGGGDYPGPGGGGYGPGGGGQGQGCMALKTKKKCLRGTDTEACAWCGESSFLGSPCVSESTAKYIPILKCKMGKGPKKNEAKVAVA